MGMFLHLAVSFHMLVVIQGLSSHSCLLAAHRENLTLDDWRCNATFNEEACVVNDRQSLIHKFGSQIGNAIPEVHRDAVCGAGEESMQCLYTTGPTGANAAVITWAEWAGTFPDRTREAQVTDGVQTLPCPQFWQWESPRSCSDALTSGVYTFNYGGTLFNFTCFVDSTGGWTVIQSRVDGSVDFYKDWSDYKYFFGDLEGNFWLGNENIHLLTSTLGQSRLRVDMQHLSESVTVYYSTFMVAGEAQQYTLTVTGYEGTEEIGDSMIIHNGMKFSTRDQDYDMNNDGSCTTAAMGVWWYNNCYATNLNGVYGQNSPQGIIWITWKTNQVSLTSVKMMVKKP